MKKWFFGFSILFFWSNSLNAQLSENLLDLKKYIESQKNIQLDSIPFLSIYRNKELHYLFPFYNAFYQANKLKADVGNEQYLLDLGVIAAFAGDYASVLAIEKIGYEGRLTDSIKKDIVAHPNLFEGLILTDAKKYIRENIKHQKIVMINELPNKPQHRAFTASLLAEFYEQGFRYLAMETLNPFSNGSLKQINMLSGHYTCEPIGGELARIAITMGFSLVAYEDTSFNHTPNKKMYTQAQNIYKILQKDPSAKILVQAEGTHNEEGARSENAIPMAAYFKIVSGIDPLTIDQTGMTEGSNHAYGDAVYDFYTKKLAINTSVVCLKDNKSKDIFDENLCDIYIIHPPTKFKNGRANWNSMNGLRNETAIQPIYQSLFFVQAYYSKEYNEKYLGKLVPADQTYINAPDGYYYLYVQKGHYQLVYRDKQYKILGTKVLVVE